MQSQLQLPRSPHAFRRASASEALSPIIPKSPKGGNTQKTLALRNFRYLANGLDPLFLLEKGEGVVRAEHRTTHKRCWVLTYSHRNAKADRKVYEKMKQLRTVDHPHVLKVLDLMKEDKSYYAVFETAEDRNAEDWLNDEAHFYGVGEKTAVAFMRQLFAALLSCSKKGVEMRSLSFKNIFFRSQPAEASLWIKLLVPLQEESDSHFTAPEVKAKLSFDPANIIYSCGMIMSALLIGESKPESRQSPTLPSHFKRSYQNWQALSPEAKSLSTALLMRDYKARPSLEACLQHPWIAASVPQPALTPALRAVLRGMQSIQPLSALQRLLYVLLLSLVMAEEELNQTQEAFRDLDSDLCGQVSAERVKAQVFRLFPEAQATAAFSALQEAAVFSDTQTLSYSDFLLHANRSALLAKNNVPTLFALLDPAQTGKLTVEHLQELLTWEPESGVRPQLWRALIEEQLCLHLRCGKMRVCLFLQRHK